MNRTWARTLPDRSRRSSFCLSDWRSRSNDLRSGHGQSPASSSHFGSAAPSARSHSTRAGKLSSNGPSTPFGYQMKWPMPSDAKFSPAFQLVSPSTVPPHSFCQTRLPIRSRSAAPRPAASADGRLQKWQQDRHCAASGGKLATPGRAGDAVHGDAWSEC